jgi:uncharacterized membrane protein
MPADLVATIGLTVVAILVAVLPGVRETPLRVVFGLPFVLFLPGYAFIALLFPEAGEGPALEDEAGVEAGSTEDQTITTGEAAVETTDSESSGSTGVLSPALESDRGIDGIERVALSFGLSIAIVPLIGLGLNFTPWGIRLTPILVSVGGFTICCAIAAAYRRWELPPDERFRVPYRQWFDAARAELLEPENRTDAILNVLLVASILLAVGSVGYAIAVPKQGESFTEFYLLTEDEEGDLVADGYPEELVRGEPAELVVGVGNQEHRSTDYTVVVQLQNVTIEDNETIVRERRELDRYRTRLDHNETWQHSHAVAPTLTGNRLRLQYLLYRGEPPADPTADTAYRDLHLWVDVNQNR